MPLTQNFALPSPQLGDENDVPADLERLAVAADSAIMRAAKQGRQAWQTYTPVWQAGSTTLAGDRVGYFLHQGYEVHYSIHITLTTVPTATGLWSVSLPMSAATFRQVTGAGYVDPKADGNGIPITAGGNAVGTIGLYGPSGRLSVANVTGLAVGGEIHIEGSYRVTTAPEL